MLTFRSWWGPASKDYTSTPCVVVDSRQEFIKSWPVYIESMSQDMVYINFSLLWTGAHRLERWLMEKSILPCVVELSLLLCEGGAASRLIISRWDLYSTCWGSWNNIWSWNMKTEWAAVCFKYSAELLESVLDHYVRGDWNHLHILYAKIKVIDFSDWIQFGFRAQTYFHIDKVKFYVTWPTQT